MEKLMVSRTVFENFLDAVGACFEGDYVTVRSQGKTLSEEPSASAHAAAIQAILQLGRVN
jgi:hypothetical protein